MPLCVSRPRGAIARADHFRRQQTLAWSHLVERLQRDADVDDDDVARVFRARMEQEAGFRIRERGGDRSLHRGAERHAAIGVEARRNVDREDRLACGVHHRHDRLRPLVEIAVEPRAEEPVDEDARAARGLGESAEPLAAVERPHSPTGALPAQAVLLRIPGEVGFTRREKHFDPDPAPVEEPRHHERVAAVVPLAGDNDDTPLEARAVALTQYVDRAGAGPLHEHLAGRAELDRPCVHRAHLGARHDVDPPALAERRRRDDPWAHECLRA